jgi:hypothetical protein
MYWYSAFTKRLRMRSIPFCTFLFEARARVWLWVSDIDRQDNVLYFRQLTFKRKSSADSKSCKSCRSWNKREKERIPMWKIRLVKREACRLTPGMTQRCKTFYLFANTFLYWERTSSELLSRVLGVSNCVLTFRRYVSLSSSGFWYC